MSKFIQIGQHRHQPLQWRSLGELDGSADVQAQMEAESPNGQLASEQALASQGKGATRRGFLGGAGLTLAAAASALSGCIRKPKELILPYQDRPEEILPGRPVWFATSARFGDQVLGVLVESQEGRPTKIEGNPKHPDSLGGTTAQAQASILDLYDPDRSQVVRTGRTPQTWADFEAFAGPVFDGLHGAGGQGLAIVVPESTSPTEQRLLADLRSRFGQARFFVSDVASPVNAVLGTSLTGLDHVTPLYKLDKADVIVALDADILNVDGPTVRYSKQFAAGRRQDDGAGSMNRLYAVEARFSVTGMMADNRLRLRSSRIGAFVAALATELFGAGVGAPPGALSLVRSLGGDDLPEAAKTWAKAVAKDLAGKPGKSAVIVGERQPRHVHAIAHLINVALGNLGTTCSFVPRHSLAGSEGLAELVAGIDAGEINAALVLGCNPVFDAPADLAVAEALGKLETTIHMGAWFDETAAVCDWHLPMSHYLESWGDHRASDGTCSVQQPLIAPLYDSRTVIDLLAFALKLEPSGDAALEVKRTWARGAPDAAFETKWRRWLHDGVIADSAPTPIAPALNAPAPTPDPVEGEEVVEPTEPAPAPGHFFKWSGLGQTLANMEAADESGIEVDFYVDNTVYDGRYGNNPWLQELPDQITKLVWDNAALLSPATARRLGVPAQEGLTHRGDKAPMVTVTLDGRSIDMPTWVTPGLADDVVVLPLGYGRSADLRYGYKVGFDVSVARSADKPWFGAGAVAKTTGGYELCSSQAAHRLEPRPGAERRPIVREATFTEFEQHPDFVEEDELIDEHHMKALFEQTNVTTGQQWGMSIDLNVCTGCANCVISCQSENNIQTVGKERVGYGREMHWIRLDRYFTGDGDDPQAVVQPMACSQCELAPCEQVCPVAATAHSPEGLNDMAYNRCIGTRYCANNCPYKVRRYNFFNYTKEQDTQNPMLTYQRNPDVTVRFRGVMEKCTYCVQRINAEKIVAKREGDGVVDDGRIVTACAQSCPTDAIVFGDISDPNSAVSKAKARPQEYSVLGELMIKPRTTYGAKLRNPNPDLA
jgi:MoCo/4Fe-4S cofactor protein with predicted Tat translocation signal